MIPMSVMHNNLASSLAFTLSFIFSKNSRADLGSENNHKNIYSHMGVYFSKNQRNEHDVLFSKNVLQNDNREVSH